MTLRIDIFNVGANACAALTQGDQLVVVDCGYGGGTMWFPSVHFAGKTIKALFITNYDEDHVRDFEDLLQKANVQRIVHSGQVSPNQIKFLKTEDEMGVGIDALVNWMQIAEEAPDYLDLTPLEHRTFHNAYPEFDDENNLSMATVFTYGRFKYCFQATLSAMACRSCLITLPFAMPSRGLRL